MLLVDRVVEIIGDQRAVGVKNVTINEPFFQGHYPTTPIMPGVLVVEAMAQLSGVLIGQSLEQVGKLPVLLSLDRVKLRKPVTPGDQLMLIGRDRQDPKPHRPHALPCLRRRRACRRGAGEIYDGG